MSIYAIIVCIGLFVILIIGIIGLVLLLTKDDRADIKRRSDLDEFAHWIAKQIFFKEVKDDLFVELTCRKLHELGIVEKRNDEWFYTTADDTDKFGIIGIETTTKATQRGCLFYWEE